MKVVVADDHAVVRRGVRDVLEDEIASVVVREATDMEQTRRRLEEEIPDLLILDLTMPGGNGLAFVGELHVRYPDLAILILSIHPETSYAVRALRAGASGYLNKECEAPELVQAVKRCANGKRHISPEVAELLADVVTQATGPDLYRELSEREFQVLCALAEGKTVGSIALELSLSPKTVSTYRVRVLEKLNLSNDAELIRYALEHQLV